KYFQHTGFISNKDAKLAEACQALNEVTPMGVADLKSAIQSAEKLFADNTSTRKLIVYIGDGVSALNPMTAEDRTILASNLLSKEIQFFAVPVGIKPDMLDMSGIASATGGALFRLAQKEKPEA
ncbi:MAG TPA: hypothetical protein PKD72_07345, partial [Gemmatales bacterium]|nr:hypothetical protein [Gemmatales bacterium]